MAVIDIEEWTIAEAAFYLVWVLFWVVLFSPFLLYLWIERQIEKLRNRV